MNSKRIPIFIGSIVLVIIVVGAGYVITQKSTDNMNMSNQKSSPSNTADAVATDKVAIASYAFSPATIKVKVGTTVTWTNNDDVKHTVTADQKSSDAPDSQLFGKGETYTFTFKKAGTYSYHCMPHQYMRGTVVVTE